MKRFNYNLCKFFNKRIEDNGWVFNCQFKGKFGSFSLRTPIMKEITYSKGPAVRYRKHFVFGIGFINSSKEFYGFAFFDPHIRLLIFTIILLGVAYVSLKIHISFVFATLFYFLISFISSDEDNILLNRCKIMLDA